MIDTVKFSTRNPYGAVVCSGAIEYAPFAIQGAEKILIVSDQKVYNLHGKRLFKILERTGAKIYTFIFPEGEGGKAKPVLDKLLILMTEINFTSADCVIGLGGGTATDLAGFGAGVFKRGVPYINIPTTLLCASDACVGGKTAINFLGRKNILGLINQPKAVFVDIDLLKTLSESQISSGYAEIIKCAVIGDKKTFLKIESGDIDIKDGILSALKVKSKVVKKDEFDKGTRRLLNFGHTFAHAIESEREFNISHGQAVAYGMLIACDVAEKLGFSKNIKGRLYKAYSVFGIDGKVPEFTEKTWNFLLSDKKIKGDTLSLILPKRIGKCKIVDIPVSRLKEILLGRKNLSE